MRVGSSSRTHDTAIEDPLRKEYMSTQRQSGVQRRRYIPGISHNGRHLRHAVCLDTEWEVFGVEQ